MIKFKNAQDQKCFLYISPKLGEVMIDLYQWFNYCGYEFVVTSVIRKKGEGKSSTHQTGRAFDVRLKNIKDENFIKDTVVFFNKKYENCGAISAEDFKPKLILVHGEGDNIHMHVQLNRKYVNIYSQNFFKEH